MEILENTTLKKKVQLTASDLQTAIINYIDKHYPKFLDDDDDFEWFSKEGIATFTYDPYKNGED